MLLLITNRKSHTRFRLVLKSTTLDDPELTLNGYYALCCITHVFRGESNVRPLDHKSDALTTTPPSHPSWVYAHYTLDLVFLLVEANFFKKPKGPLFQIGSAWNLDDCSSKRLHRLTESGFWYYVIISIYTSILGQFRHPEISCRWRSLKTKTGECGHLPDF